MLVFIHKGIGMENVKAARTRGPGISGSTSYWYFFGFDESCTNEDREASKGHTFS